MFLGKPFFIKMNNINVKSLKGYNAFSKVIVNGKKIKVDDLTSFFIYNDNKLNFLKSSNHDLIYIGVTSSKRGNKKAVLRNRIKRLLRVAVSEFITKDVVKYKIIKYAVFMYNKKIPYSNFVKLSDIEPLVERALNKAVEYKLKKQQNWNTYS